MRHLSILVSCFLYMATFVAVGLFNRVCAIEIKMEPPEGMNQNDDAVEAFEWAALQYETMLDGNIEIKVDIEWKATGNYVLAGMGSSYGVGISNEFLKAQRPDVTPTEYQFLYIPLALWQQLYPGDTEKINNEMAGGYHMSGYISGTENWYYEMEQNTVNGQPDFRATMLHELAHGLGFARYIQSNGYYFGGSGTVDGYPGAFDLYVAGRIEMYLVTVR